MSDTNIVKKGYDLAQKEIEEKEIERVKNIIKDYLKELQEKEGQNKKLVKEISLLKKDIDDFKSGRLDKIEERQKIEPLSPKIVIITRVEREYVPMQPWYSPFQITYPVNPYPYVVMSSISQSSHNALALGSDLVIPANQSFCSSDQKAMVGNVFRNFSSGSYDVGGEIINL